MDGTDATDLVRENVRLKVNGLVGSDHGPLDCKTVPL